MPFGLCCYPVQNQSTFQTMRVNPTLKRPRELYPQGHLDIGVFLKDFAPAIYGSLMGQLGCSTKAGHIMEILARQLSSNPTHKPIGSQLLYLINLSARMGKNKYQTANPQTQEPSGGIIDLVLNKKVGIVRAAEIMGIDIPMASLLLRKALKSQPGRTKDS